MRGQSGRGRGAPQFREVHTRGHREVHVVIVSRVCGHRIQRFLRFLLIVVTGVVLLLPVGGPVLEVSRIVQIVFVRVSAAGIQHVVELVFQQPLRQGLIVVVVRRDGPRVLVRHSASPPVALYVMCCLFACLIVRGLPRRFPISRIGHVSRRISRRIRRKGLTGRIGHIGRIWCSPGQHIVRDRPSVLR